MTDRVPGAPGQYKATITNAELQKLQNGEEFNITLIRDDQPAVEGTPYNKASVLPDELAAVICPEVEDPTPADAFAHLLPAIESTDYPGCYYRTVDGVTEWLNPPMVAGVEYRTTERHQGKPVYRKLVRYTNTATIGNESGCTSVEIPHGVSGLSSLIRIGAKVNTYRLPYISQSGGITDACAVNTTNITLRMVNTSWTSREWIFDLAYIK